MHGDGRKYKYVITEDYVIVTPTIVS